MHNSAEKPIINRYQTFGIVGRPVIQGNLDVSHGTVLYMEDVSVSFDGFKALNNLSLYIDDGELRLKAGNDLCWLALYWVR